MVVSSPFLLDRADERLLRDGVPIPLTPKAYSVLVYLIDRAGRLATKEAILQAVWGDIHVNDAVLKVCIHEVRRALGDAARQPRHVETVHRRGYRFIGRIEGPRPAPPVRRTHETIVGRVTGIADLGRWYARALGGERQVVFVTGEAGIGKTAIVDAFLQRIAPEPGIWIVRSTCLERYGNCEAYFPVLEALGRLARGPGRHTLHALLRRFAPTWLVQLPSLMEDDDLQPLRHEILDATKERMLREMANAIEALTETTPLVLVLEDLHWSDYSTLDLMSSLARRRGPARLMLVGTYRPAEVALSHHPLQAASQELEMRRRCRMLPLELLSEEAVSDYLSRRIAGFSAPVELVRMIRKRTDGNPLFMVNVVDDLEARHLIGPGPGRIDLERARAELESGVPENLRQMVEKQVERLTTADQELLEAASVAGLEFPAAALSAALGWDLVSTERSCADLAGRMQFVRSIGLARLPDGSLTPRFAFIHSLYQNVLYRRLPPVRRLRLQRRMGELAITAFGDRESGIAAGPAVH